MSDLSLIWPTIAGRYEKVSGLGEEGKGDFSVSTGISDANNETSIDKFPSSD